MGSKEQKSPQPGGQRFVAVGLVFVVWLVLTLILEWLGYQNEAEWALFTGIILGIIALIVAVFLALRPAPNKTASKRTIQTHVAAMNPEGPLPKNRRNLN